VIKRATAAQRRLMAIVLTVCLAAACGSDDSDNAIDEVALEDIETESRTFVDRSRPTRPNGTFPGSDERTIATRIWFAPEPLDRPACRGQRCALVVLAHGFGGSTARFDAIARRLAVAGYVVAAPAFPLTNQNAPGGHLTAFGDVVSQPADLSFVLDRLLEANENRDDVLHERIDSERVAALGHSLGGATVIAASRSDCCRDDRVGATLLVAPASFIVAGSFGGPYATDGPPTLTVVGSADPLVSPASVAPFVTAIEPPKIYLELQGGDHVFIIEATEEVLDPLLDRTADMSIAFLDRSFAGVDAVAEVAADLRAEGHTVVID